MRKLITVQGIAVKSPAVRVVLYSVVGEDGKALI